MATVVIMPGGFHPFHAGHLALYQSAQRAFPDAEVYVAATNDTAARPFPFAVKEKLAKLAGVEPGHFVQVKSPFRAEEITAQFDPQSDNLIFVRSEKDANKPPQAGGIKKDGSASYLQPLLGAKKLEPFAKHAYMAYLPTVEFGGGLTSASEIRAEWPTLDNQGKIDRVVSLYPRIQGNAKLADTVVKLLDAAIGSAEGVAEGATVTRIDSKPIADFSSGLKAYKHTDDWSQSGIDTGDDSYWKNKNLKTKTTKGLFAGDPRRTALYATGNAHETRYVEFTLDGQPIVYFDKKDLPAMRSRKTYLTVFDASNFKQLPTGEWFSENPGKPIKQTPIGDPFKYIADQGWIVRVTDDLDKVFNQVKKMHNAGEIAQYGAEGMNESQLGVAESVEFMSDAQFYGEILSVLAAMGAGLATGAYLKARDIVKMYNADRIMRALEGYRVGNISDAERQALTKLIAEFKQAMVQRQGEQALAIAKQIKTIATDRTSVAEGWKDVVAGGAMALAAMGAGAQSMPNINAQQVELTNKYYKVLVQRAVEDGKTLDARTKNFLMAKAQDAAAQKIQKSTAQTVQTKPQQGFPTQGSERRVAKDAGQFESADVDENQGWAATLETVSATGTTANTSGAGAGMTATYQRRDNQPIAEDYLSERRL